MGRVILAVILGAAVHFFWGYLSHVVLGLHDQSFGRLKNEDALISLLGSSVESDKDLAYYFPVEPPAGYGKGTAEENKAFEDKHKRGPVGVILYNAGGKEVMGTQTFVTGALLDVVATILAIAVLWMTLPAQQNYLKRVFIIVAMGIFAAVTRDLAFWNWMSYPFDYSMMNAADTVVGWTAVGLVVAAIVKPTAATTA